MGNHMTTHHHHAPYYGPTGILYHDHDPAGRHSHNFVDSVCYADHDLSLWQQLRVVLREMWAELQPEAIAARLDAWVERQQR